MIQSMQQHGTIESEKVLKVECALKTGEFRYSSLVSSVSALRKDGADKYVPLPSWRALAQ